MNSEIPQHLVALRRSNPAWLLLASRNGPLTITILRTLVESHPGGVSVEDSVEQLAAVFSRYANDSDFDTGESDNYLSAARRELRQWIKRGLIVERDGNILATDPLQRALAFLDGLEQRTMTSTASRLSTVQRVIEELDARLSVSQSKRAGLLRQRIADLRRQLEAVERGEFDVLDGPPAIEGIREVYQLALSLRADFRRVEDSYREADLVLRQTIISEKRHRGEIVDELLAGHEALVNTPEGQVFEGFHRQLVDSAELEQMKGRLRAILENQNTEQALDRKQKRDLRELLTQLVSESERVIQARARSERDVRGFITSGLADEQLRVGAILQDIFQVALDVDWQRQGVRRTRAPLPPVAVALAAPSLPVVDRLLVREAITADDNELDFSGGEGEPALMDREFWDAYHGLDREALFRSTVEYLAERGEPLTLGALAEALPPSHDLETLAYWLAMARQVGIEVEAAHEQIELFDEDYGWTRFHAPRVELEHALIEGLNQDELD